MNFITPRDYKTKEGQILNEWQELLKYIIQSEKSIIYFNRAVILYSQIIRDDIEVSEADYKLTLLIKNAEENGYLQEVKDE